MLKYRLFFLLIILGMISGCSTRGKGVYNDISKVRTVDYDTRNDQEVEYTLILDPRMLNHPTMRPYKVHGKRYYPRLVKVGETFKGVASWYGPNFHGKLTSNGEVYDMHAMTAAHKTLPISTVVRVTNLDNGKTAIVRINDRGPFVDTRIIDLSNRAAKQIDMVAKGTAHVRLEVLGFDYRGKKQYKVRKHIRKKPRKKEKNFNGHYSLQIASFTNIKGAIKTQEKYDGYDGYESVILDSIGSRGSSYKVLLRGFKNRNEVIAYKERNFPDAFILREKESY